MFSRRPTPATRSVLCRPVHHVDGFIAVDVVDRRDYDDHAIEEGPQVAARQAPHQHLHGFLPLHLAAVDVGEQEDDRAASRAFGRLAHRRIGECHEWHRPPLFRRPESLDAHQR